MPELNDGVVQHEPTTACTKCGGPAVTRLAYNQQDLCRNCFCGQFEKRVRKANHDFGLFRRGDVVAVAVSGGKDSTAMLFALDKLARDYSFSLKPVLIDEGIGGYRNVAMKNAEQLCQKLGHELHVVTYKGEFGAGMDEVMQKRDGLALSAEGFDPKPSCTYCGVFRKQSLNKAALDVGATKLAVGHNADDIGQTFLMNLLRSETRRIGRGGAVSGAVERGGLVTRVKPLVYNLEIECAIYCRLNSLPFHLGGCPYAAESFRGQVKDFLNAAEADKPGVKFNLLQSFLKLREKMGDEAAGELSYCSECGAPCGGAKCKACQFGQELMISKPSRPD